MLTHNQGNSHRINKTPTEKIYADYTVTNTGKITIPQEICNYLKL